MRHKQLEEGRVYLAQSMKPVRHGGEGMAAGLTSTDRKRDRGRGKRVHLILFIQSRTPAYGVGLPEYRAVFSPQLSLPANVLTVTER